MLKNGEIRNHAAQKKVRFWRVAERLGIADCTLAKRMRHELSEQEKQRVLSIIDKIAAEDARMKEDEH